MLLRSKISQYHIGSNCKRFFSLPLRKKKISDSKSDGFIYRTFPETVFTLNQLVCKNTKKKEVVSVDVSLQWFPGGAEVFFLCDGPLRLW